jgi:hypothetical protein
MALFAKLDQNNIVIDLIEIDNIHLKEPINGKDEEILGIAYCIKMYGGMWKQTSTNMRVHLAGIGYSYDSNLDAFIPQKPYNSWILNNDTLLWQPPIPKPSNSEIKENEDNGFILTWDEQNISWKFMDTKLLTEENINFINNNIIKLS